MKAPAILSTLFIILVLAAGCSTVVWEKPGTTSAELTDDMAACRQVATTTHLETQDWVSGSPTLFLPVAELDYRAFDACMRQRGYVASRTER